LEEKLKKEKTVESPAPFPIRQMHGLPAVFWGSPCMEKSVKLWQHRTIWQEGSARIFVPIQSLENGGILYVFPIFQTEEVGQKDG